MEMRHWLCTLVLISCSLSAAAQTSACTLAVSGYPSPGVVTPDTLDMQATVDCGALETSGIEISVSTAPNGIAEPSATTIPVTTPNGTASFQLHFEEISQCTEVTIIVLTVGLDQNLEDKTELDVCPNYADLQMKSLTVNNLKPAGQQSEFTATLANEGIKTFYPSSYAIRFSTDPDPAISVPATCINGGSVRGPGNRPTIEPGETKSAENLRFRFPQAGTFRVVAEADPTGNDDDMSNNTFISSPLTIDLPSPEICGVYPLRGNGGVTPVTIEGNWFRTYATNEIPEVHFDGVPHAVQQVESPVKIKVSAPVICTPSTTVRVTNGTGMKERSFQLPEGPQIVKVVTSLTPDRQRYNVRVQLSNFRSKCDAKVTMDPVILNGVPLAVGGPFDPNILLTTQSSIRFRIYNTGRLEQWRVRVATDYGDAFSEPILIGAPLRRLPDHL